MNDEVFPTLQTANGPAKVAKVQAALTLVCRRVLERLHQVDARLRQRDGRTQGRADDDRPEIASGGGGARWIVIKVDTAPARRVGVAGARPVNATKGAAGACRASFPSITSTQPPSSATIADTVGRHSTSSNVASYQTSTCSPATKNRHPGGSPRNRITSGHQLGTCST